ncbi:MAG: electron transport complex subunit E [Bacilli bacterium]|jgi:electron transport complex protein RnfE|nr:electron transport complex subunit E [Bacilli bacterium]MDD4056653.1 electron transport complex subunit E [Bacilli bacterium]
MTKLQNFTKGIMKENPILVSILGLCPTLAITTSVENALGMGVAILFVLTFSNLIISLIRNIVPNEIRIPIFIVVIATLVTLVDMLMAAFLPALHESLGIFIPLIVVNCIILGRAEAYASKNKPFDSVIDGIGMAVGYTLVLIVISFIREFLASGAVTIWGDLQLNLNADQSAQIFTSFFTSPAGAFIVLGLLLGTVATIRNQKKEVKKQ